MSAPTCEIEGATVVLVGHFNPALVQPAWLARHALVRDAEADAAEIQLIRPEMSLFNIGPFRFQAELERFVVSIADMGQMQALRDLIVSSFTLLSHTPVRQFGLNRLMHFRMRDVQSWHRVGDALAPKEKWNLHLVDPGLRSLSIWGKREGSQAMRIEVRVEPSTKVPSGVYVAVNEHYEVEAEDAGPAIDLLRAEWDASFAHARILAESIASLGS